MFLVQLLGCGLPVEQEENGLVVPLGLTQTELAYWVGTSRETVERILSGWAARRGGTPPPPPHQVPHHTPHHKNAGVRPAQRRRAALRRPFESRKTGGILLSRGLAPQVPSARAGLTSLFGMGRGNSPSL